ncbi:MAG TPA: M23 family metallopeptidase [Candidatus Angelobacter sp.]|nr:M23 family metallopeptidase [Candidatus Angelobacter sp.]
MYRFLRSLSTAGILLAVLSVAAGASTAETWKVQWQPEHVVNGSPVLFRVTPPEKLKAVTGNFLGQALDFRFSDACQCWYALAGVSLHAKPGNYELHLQGEASGAGAKPSQNRSVMVGAANYPSSALAVAPGFVEPPKETLARIEEDQAIKKRIFATTLPEPLWSGRFKAPAEAEFSGVFGSARVFNGVKKSQHTGLDFRVGTGTPIHAANSGTVILARPMYFEGNCVIIDHGQGLLTLYLHLSEFKVKEGEKVETGQLLGLSGGTGRATAPHLHFAVRWRGEYLNPATLLELRPPEN